jgi:imidazolonepropionase-like amidohydrolase
MSSLVLRRSIFTGDTFIETGCALVDQSNGVIVEVGRKSEVSEPEGARILDVQGSTILPGPIDSHIHFFGSKKYHLME